MKTILSNIILLAFTLVCIVIVPIYAQTYNVTTLVGGDSIVGDGLDATSAKLYGPYGIAFNSNGEMLIADANNNRIRKIALNGTITTVAGTGSTAGYNGDNILATSAKLNSPSGIAINSNGEIFIADTINHRIRKIMTNGTITTIAGTSSPGYNGDNVLATSAQLNYPSGVAITSNGDIIISDTNNNRIRLISTLNGNITTIAGTGASGYYGDGILATSAKITIPRGIAISSSGEIYFADANNYRVRKILTNGTIVTIAGTSSPGYNGDNILATSAQLNYPSGVAITSNGDIIISDTSNSRIRLISTLNGNITTIAGTSSPGYNGDGILATSAKVNYPKGVVINSIGEIYFADANNYRIRKISLNGIITTVAGNPNFVTDSITSYTEPSGSPSIYNNTLLYTDTYGKVRLVNLTSLNVTNVGSLSNLACAKYYNNQYYVLYNKNYLAKLPSLLRIVGYSYSPVGGYDGDGSLATNAKLNNANGIAFSSSGEMLIADTNNHRIRKVSINGIISTIAGTGAAGYNGDGILAINAQLYYPYAVAVNSIGEVLIVDSNNHRIRKILTNGNITTIGGTGASGYNGDNILATSAKLSYPYGIAISSNGDVIISDTNNNRIRKILTNGTITTIGGTGTAGYNNDNILATSAYLNNPRQIVISSIGEIYFADTNNYRIRKIVVRFHLTQVY